MKNPSAETVAQAPSPAYVAGPTQKTVVKLTRVNVAERVDADVFEGYYLIGRHDECQIRPKSSSVAERHCLIEHRVGLLRVFDLESETGTFVNDEQLKPKTWRFLSDKDSLRCGKIEFAVSIEKNPLFDANNIAANGEAISSTDQPINEAKESEPEEVDEFDFDSFADDFALASEVDTGPVRLSLNNNDSANSTHQPELITDEPTEDDFVAAEPEPAEPLSKADQKALAKQRKLAAKAEAKQMKLANKKAKRREIPKPKAIKPARQSRSFGSSGGGLKNPEFLKLVGAFVLAASILTLFGYQFYQFTQPNQTRIIQEQYDSLIK